MRIKIQQVGIYETLVAQLDRIFRHNRQGSFHTKRRYYEAMKRFCAYLADMYHLNWPAVERFVAFGSASSSAFQKMRWWSIFPTRTDDFMKC